MELARLWPERADPFLEDAFREALAADRVA